MKAITATFVDKFTLKAHQNPWFLIVFTNKSCFIYITIYILIIIYLQFLQHARAFSASKHSCRFIVNLFHGSFKRNMISDDETNGTYFQQHNILVPIGKFDYFR